MSALKSDESPFGTSADPGRQDERGRREIALLRHEVATLRALCLRYHALVERRRCAISHPAAATARSWTGAVLGIVDFRRGRSLSAWESQQIKDAGVFDAEWYLDRYPDVAESEIDPLHHYLRFGAGERREPNPLFDPNWYVASYPEVAKGRLTPLGHFAAVGASKLYDPHPLFLTAWYVSQNKDVAESGMNPLRHHLLNGGRERGCNPNPLFDSAWYLDEYRDVRESGINPLVHYLHYGIAEMRNPHPLFDAAWYLESYEHVAASGLDALEHYLTIGIFEGYRTAPQNATPRQSRLSITPPGALKPVVDEGARGCRRSNSIAAPETATAAWRIDLTAMQSKEPDFEGEIGIFVHLFYPELAAELAANILAIPFRYKVYVSTNDKKKKDDILAVFNAAGIQPVIKVVPNRGWDIAPFILSFAEEIRKHEICLKIHGKNSVHSPKGAQWRRYLLSGLLGHSNNIREIVHGFQADSRLGVLMLPHWKPIARHASTPGSSYRHLKDLLNRFGLDISAKQKIDFPSGSMFWFRGGALTPLLDLQLTWSDFANCHPRKLDATFAHAIERSVLIMAALSGYHWSYHSAIKPRLRFLRPSANARVT